MLDVDAGTETRLTTEIMTRFDNGRAWPSVRPERDNQIAVVSEASGDRRILVINSQGETLVDLGPGEFPAWSPDGNSLAFVRGSKILVAPPDVKGAPTRLNTNLDRASYPAWHPDGETLVIVGTRDGTVDLYEVAISSQSVRQLTNSKDVAEVSPTWSPDGTMLAFAASASEPKDGWQHSIYVVDVSTDNVREITSGQFHDTRPTWISGRAP